MRGLGLFILALVSRYICHLLTQLVIFENLPLLFLFNFYIVAAQLIVFTDPEWVYQPYLYSCCQVLIVWL